MRASWAAFNHQLVIEPVIEPVIAPVVLIGESFKIVPMVHQRLYIVYPMQCALKLTQCGVHQHSVAQIRACNRFHTPP